MAGSCCSGCLLLCRAVASSPWVLAPSARGERAPGGRLAWPLSARCSRAVGGRVALVSCAQLERLAHCLNGPASASSCAAERDQLTAGPELFCVGEPLPVHLVGQELQVQHAGLPVNKSSAGSDYGREAAAGTMWLAHDWPTACPQDCGWRRLSNKAAVVVITGISSASWVFDGASDVSLSARHVASMSASPAVRWAVFGWITRECHLSPP